VIARVNDKKLTRGDLLSSSFSGGDLSFFLQRWVDDRVVLDAAFNGHLNKDSVIIAKVGVYYDKLLISSYLDIASAGGVDISNQQIRVYYNKNKDSFYRRFDEAVVYHFVVKGAGVASEIKSTFSRGGSGVTRKELLLKYGVEPLVVRRGQLLAGLDKMVFSKSKKSLHGPVFSGGAYHIISIIKKHAKGTLIGLDKAHDEIYSRLFQIEKNKKISMVLDSLKNISTVYVNKEFVYDKK